MNTEQMKLLLPLLGQFKEYLSAMSCNDWDLPNTPEGKALWMAINQWSDSEDTGEWGLEDMSRPTLFMADLTALKYLIYCIKNNLIQPE